MQSIGLMIMLFVASALIAAVPYIPIAILNTTGLVVLEYTSSTWVLGLLIIMAGSYLIDLAEKFKKSVDK
jgi:hypothetical protein